MGIGIGMDRVCGLSGLESGRGGGRIVVGAGGMGAVDAVDADGAAAMESPDGGRAGAEVGAGDEDRSIRV